MKLYELSELYVGLLNQIEDGDLELEQMEDALNVIQGEFNTKAENVVKMIKSLEYSIEAVKSETKRLGDQKKRLERSVDSLKSYLLDNMNRTGVTKIKSDLFSIGIRNNPISVDVYDEMEFIRIAKEHFPELIKEEVSIKVDKKGVKEILSSDENLEIPGVKLQRTKGLSIK